MGTTDPSSRASAPSFAGRGFKALTFDCYGTLIDWQRGIVEALQPIVRRHGIEAYDLDLLWLYSTFEAPIQAENPSMRYAEVLRRVMDRFAAHLGLRLTSDDRDVLVRTLPDWPAFPDTAAALAALGASYKLCITSNIDNDLIAQTLARLGVRFDEVVTAQQLGSYKPQPAHWREAMRRMVVRREDLLHVAQSLYHDIAPAKSLGISTAWVNRYGSEAGATPHATATPDLEVASLAELAKVLC